MKTKIRKSSAFLEVKAVTEAGEFEGYASTFGGEPDSAGDIVAPGAFKSSLERMARSDQKALLLYGHDRNNEIGEILELREDQTGLYMRAKLWIDGDHPDASAMKAYRGMTKQSGRAGLSIGYITIDEKQQPDGTWLLREVDVREVSVVTFPANTNARVTDVKSEMPTIREIEKTLTGDLGLTAKQAKTLLSQGYAKAAEGERDADQGERDALSGVDALIQTLRG